MRKILVWSLKLIGSIVGIVVLYLLLGYFIPFIPVTAEKTDDPKLIEAYIMTNGVHTDLVVPVKHELMDWSQKVLFHRLKVKILISII